MKTTNHLGSRFFRTCLWGGCLLFLGAPAWALTGQLIDNSGNALAGATVKLIVANLSGTTDSSGNFDLETTTISTIDRSWNSTPYLQNGVLSFAMPQAGKADIALYSLRGALVDKISQNYSAGLQAISLNGQLSQHGSGLYVVVLRRGSNTQAFRYFYKGMSGNGFTMSSMSTKASSLAKTTSSDSIVDTLLIYKTIGDVTSSRKVKIYGYDDNINDYMSTGTQILIIDDSNDNDGDGLTNYEERYVYFTNSEIADTDGDGVSDYDEIVDSKDPLIANVPDFTFTPATYPQMVASYTTSEGTSSEQTITESEEYTESSSFSATQELNWQAELAIMVGGEYSFGKDAGGKVSGSVTATLGVGGSLSFTEEYSKSLSESWESSQTYATSTDMTFSGGTISVDVILTNNSGTNLTLVEPVVRLSTNGYQINALSTQIGELQLSESATTIYIPSASGSNSVTRTFTASISNPDLFDEIAGKANGLTIQLQNIKFQTSLGETDTLMNNVYNRTALVLVDYGYYSSSKSLIKKYVVTRNKYNQFYTSQTDRFVSSTLAEVLATAGATVTNDSTDGHYGIQSIDDLANGAFTSGSWGVVLQNSNDTDSVTVYGVGGDYDPTTIDVYGNSVIDVVYSADADGDNLTGRAEVVLGTDEEKWDTDGDGLSDGEEVFGWESLDSTQDTVWETNPLLMDTDGDDLTDSIDPDPLTAAVNPDDSLVLLAGISVIPTQGSSWTKAMTDTDTTTQWNVTVDSLMRGPSTLSLTFSHSIYMMVVIGNSDTTGVYSPTSDTDSTKVYEVSLPLVLGKNSIQVLLYSKNGAQKKVLNLTIDRRLIQVNPTNTSFFKVSSPSADLMGIGANAYVNVDSIMTLDPLVTEVYLMRVDVNRLSYTSSDSIQALIAQDLGDSGDGDANLDAGSLVYGKVSSSSNTYRVVEVLTSTGTITNSDSTTKRINDFVYFPYTANTGSSNGKNYYTAPSTGKGIYYSNPRSIVIDSMYAMMVQTAPYGYLLGIPINWQYVVQMNVTVNGVIDSIQNSDWAANGSNIPKMTDTIAINQEIGISDSIQCNYYGSETWFRASDAGIWLNYGTQPSAIYYKQIVYPETYTVDSYAYGAYTVGDFSDTLWILEVNLISGSHAFDDGIRIYWHFKYGEAHTTQGG
ncbi:MAG TPA: hypothetical protein VLM37_06770 [Fibrobacteraceae bacterium]|nr:hypothetical protein [Fibrobacteraceae bacterium]